MPRTPLPIALFTLSAALVVSGAGPLLERPVPPRPAVCFAPGTPDAYRLQVEESFGVGKTAAFTASDFSRWSFTATDGFKSAQGSPITLTWSVVPDGTRIPGDFGAGAGGSDLRAMLDDVYGSETTWLPILQSVFDRWGELCGVTYVHETNDDGATLGGAGGQLGVRADIRIGGKAIDGNLGILAYNGFPNDGDMVIDTSDSFYLSTFQNSRRLRNVIAHEHGHGLALDHVCPQSRTKLMEPTANVNFDGPQTDDIRGAQRLYGDRFEPNDALASAEVLDVPFGRELVLRNVSIDDDGDTDLYAFDAPNGGFVDLVLRPVGGTYRSGAQEFDGTCGSTTEIVARAEADLRLAVLASDARVVAAVDDAAAGESEELIDVPLPDGEGRYYVRVRNSGENRVQLYELSVVVAQRGEKPVALDDAVSTREVTPVTASVLDNDAGLADLPIAVRAITSPSSGQVKLDDGRLIYVPRHGFTGLVSFRYEVSDANGQTDTAEVTIDVTPSPRAGDARLDGDGDGYPTELESELGTSDDDPGDRPGPFAREDDVLDAGVSKCTLVLKPQKPEADKLALRGLLPVPGGYEPEGRTVVVYVGGVARTFTLDRKGRAKAADGTSFKLRLRKKKGVVRGGAARFDVKWKRADLADAFADEALVFDRNQNAEPRAVTVLVVFEDQALASRVRLDWSARPGRTGKAKVTK